MVRGGGRGRGLTFGRAVASEGQVQRGYVNQKGTQHEMHDLTVLILLLAVSEAPSIFAACLGLPAIPFVYELSALHLWIQLCIACCSIQLVKVYALIGMPFEILMMVGWGTGNFTMVLVCASVVLGLCMMKLIYLMRMWYMVKFTNMKITNGSYCAIELTKLWCDDPNTMCTPTSPAQIKHFFGLVGVEVDEVDWVRKLEPGDSFELTKNLPKERHLTIGIQTTLGWVYAHN
jgi:hypothetical protein